MLESARARVRLQNAYRTLCYSLLPAILHRIIIIASSLQVCQCPISRHAPSLRDILELCASLRGWLKLDCKNVAVSFHLFALALSLSRALALTTYSLAHTHTLCLKHVDSEAHTHFPTCSASLSYFLLFLSVALYFPHKLQTPHP